MKRIFTITLIVFSLLHYATAGQPQPGVNELKVYADSSGALYWPVDLPVWIKMSTRPDDSGQTFSFFEMDSSSMMDETTYRNEGIHLEIPGQQFIRWAHYMKRDTVMLKFHADDGPPQSTLKLFGAPKYIRGNTVFYGKGLTGTLNSRDYHSGVETIYYSLNKDQYGPYTDAFIFNEEKKYHFAFFAVDRVGYSENLNVSDFFVDLTPPKSSHSVSENFIENILSSVSVFQLNSTDGLSDIESIYYKFDDDKEFMTYKGSNIPVPDLPDGEHKFIYFAMDRVKNNETPVVFNFELDRIPPVPTIEIKGEQIAGDSGPMFISPRTRIILDAEDNRSGVDHIEYRINGSEWGKYTGQFTGPLNAAPFRVDFKAFDRLGNMSTPEDLTLYMDPNPPKSSYIVHGPSYSQRGVEWIKSSSNVTLNAVDDLSGVLNTSYKIGNTPEKTYADEKIQITEEGRHLFRYWSLDRVKNHEVDQAILIIVDDTAPEIMETFSILPVDTLDRNGQMVLVYPRFTSVFLAAVDNSAGIQGIWYNMNNTGEQPFLQTLFFRDEGEFDIDVRCLDNLGNESRTSFSFMIKDDI